ncbi:hypothetical protein BDK51DRAFT_38570 [Blyttiomyces helicus]|uniref:Uncharacterized protein n=1 Tax=Blyttiomyces helicus TaxID=388810 RepID=A0A4P9W971_9FUNG|nr:hypothetical protein BDK51DRAFT_38570 [Blyttiomyces helicus]|eukprot:RKO88702.1 hypothetical protein BDK51DRAFT_38570 [Blyttiomyces helicus]
MGSIVHHYSIHFHADVARGRTLIFSREVSPKLSGISKTDTITVDSHTNLSSDRVVTALLSDLVGGAHSREPAQAKHALVAEAAATQALENEDGKEAVAAPRPDEEQARNDSEEGVEVGKV